jgi:phosphatidylserine decarboxylase
MTARAAIVGFFQRDRVNFVLTNCLPRRQLTRFVGWFSKVEQPFVRDLSIAVWRFFAGFDLAEAKQTRFASMHDCFTRELKDGARPFDPDPAVVASPCDAIVGACGRIDGDVLIQAKGHDYTLQELLCDPQLAQAFRGGRFVTLRLSSGMYHRFHAPHDGHVSEVTYIAGDVWNVNPGTLRRVPKLYCRNERALVPLKLAATGDTLLLVPVAAILVASIRLHFLDVLLHLKHPGPNVMHCDATLRKGEEMGWFEHGSTIIVIAPGHFTQCTSACEGALIRAGEPLLRLPARTGA